MTRKHVGIILTVIAVILPVIMLAYLRNQAESHAEAFKQEHPDFFPKHTYYLTGSQGMYAVKEWETGSVVNDAVIRFEKSEEIWQAQNGSAKLIWGSPLKIVAANPFLFLPMLFLFVIGLALWLNSKPEEPPLPG